MAATTLPARKRARASRGGPLERQATRLFWPFVGPALAFYGLLFLAPIAYATWTSLYKWDGMGAMKWRGLGNYQQLLDDEAFHYAVQNTVKILVVGGVITFAVSFALTLALREMAGKMFARSVLFFPCLVNALVFGIAAGFLFGPNGPINKVLNLLGVDAVPKWLSIDNLPAMIIATIVWTATGYYTTIIMAAVDQIPTYLYEAAELEGANAWQRFRHVTLPLSWEVVSVCAVLWTVSSVKVFEIVLLFGGGATVSNAPIQTWTTAMYVYFSAFPQSSVPKLGLAAAAAVVSLVMVGLFVLILRRMMRRERVSM